MTYDPLAYGQVQMGGDDKASSDAPDDILFANGATPAADASWGLLDEDVGSLLPGGVSSTPSDFGNDILGGPPPAAAPVAAPVRARPAVKPRPGIAATGRPAAPMPTQRPVVEPARLAAPAPAAVVVRRASSVRLGPGSRLTGLLLPAVVFAAGGTVAAWLYAMQQNHVMGGIVVALSVIAATFARVFLRG
ncbi:MAG: hypothetical protein JNM25_04075 [Planctomycetes bacterium]|nr:hypothetical protein [Planctomycetota bacterium]